MSRDKETFITEDDRENGFSIICDSDDIIGVDMVSQSTLLQRKLDEMKGVDLELLATKKETDAIVARVEIGETEFRAKQELFRKQISNFQKFIVDSDRKRARKLRQIDEEKKIVVHKDEIIVRLDAELVSLNERCKSLNCELVALIKYQHYLNRVINSGSNNYSMIDELLQRHTILMDTHNALKAENMRLNAKIEEIINEKNKYIANQSNVILVRNSSIAQCIKLIETKKNETVNLEHRLFKQYQKNQQVEKVQNMVKLSIINIYSRIYQSYPFKKPKFLNIEHDDVDFNLLLSEICRRLADLTDIKETWVNQNDSNN